MAEHIWVHPIGQPEIGIFQYGAENCAPRHRYGPALRDHYLLHFIVGGQGIFSHGGRDVALHAGEGFLICPEEITSYVADGEDPWHYCWIGFSGDGAERLLTAVGLSEEKAIFTFDKPEEILALFADLHKAKETELSGQLELTGILYRLLSRIRPAGPRAAAPRRMGIGEDYVESAILYIREKYASPITVAGLAEYLGLNRSYFSALFRAHTKKSPKQFLSDVRMSKAAQLLSDGRLSVAQVAKSVGYEDPLQFSRMFRRFYGVSPREHTRGKT